MFVNNNLIQNIQKLPIFLQKKIYVITWKLFWRSLYILTAQIPSWYHHKIKIENIIFQSRLKIFTFYIYLLIYPRK